MVDSVKAVSDASVADVKAKAAADAVAALLRDGDFHDIVQAHKEAWSPRRDRELVAWLLLMAENSVIPAHFLTLPLTKLPLRLGVASDVEAASVEKATNLMQLFHSLKQCSPEAIAQRFLVLQVRISCCHAVSAPIVMLLQFASCCSSAGTEPAGCGGVTSPRLRARVGKCNCNGFCPRVRILSSVLECAIGQRSRRCLP